MLLHYIFIHAIIIYDVLGPTISINVRPRPETHISYYGKKPEFCFLFAITSMI